MTYTVYIDGACSNNGCHNARAGWGAFITNPAGVTLELAAPVPWHEPQTNNRAELLAFLEAMARCTGPEPIIAHSDSQLLVKGAMEWLPKWKANGWRKADKKVPEHLDLWERIDVVMQERQVMLVWVRGHNGDPGNERADALAMLGSSGKTYRRRSDEPVESVPA